MRRAFSLQMVEVDPQTMAELRELQDHRSAVDLRQGADSRWQWYLTAFGPTGRPIGPAYRTQNEAQSAYLAIKEAAAYFVQHGEEPGVNCVHCGSSHKVRRIPAAGNLPAGPWLCRDCMRTSRGGR